MLLGGHIGSSPAKYREFVHQMTCMFRRQPKLLMDIIEHNIQCNPRFKQTLLRAIVPLDKHVEHAEQLNMIFKFSQGISNRKWNTEVVPIWKDEVCNLFNLFVIFFFLRLQGEECAAGYTLSQNDLEFASTSTKT